MFRQKLIGIIDEKFSKSSEYTKKSPKNYKFSLVNFAHS